MGIFGKKKVESSSSQEYLQAAYTLWFEQRKAKKAIKECEAAIELDPNSSIAYCMISDIHREEKRFDDAVGFYQRALKINPNYSLARSNLGMTHHLLGDEETSAKEWKETLRRGVESTMIRMNTEDFLKDARERLANRDD